MDPILEYLRSIPNEECSTVRRYLRPHDLVLFGFARTRAGLYLIDRTDFDILKTPSLAYFTHLLTTHFKPAPSDQRAPVQSFEGGLDEFPLSESYALRVGACIEHALLTQLWAQTHELESYHVIGWLHHRESVEAHAFNVVNHADQAHLVDTFAGVSPGVPRSSRITSMSDGLIGLEEDSYVTYAFFHGRYAS